MLLKDSRAPLKPHAVRQANSGKIQILTIARLPFHFDDDVHGTTGSYRDFLRHRCEPHRRSLCHTDDDIFPLHRQGIILNTIYLNGCRGALEGLSGGSRHSADDLNDTMR